MNGRDPALEQRYAAALDQYLDGAGEAPLSAGYDLARSALAQGLGVLDLAQMHRHALQRHFAADRQGQALVAQAGGFLAECLSPFELSHRGALEGVQAMRRVNELLEAELQRIAHSLHDEAGQLLASVHLAVAALADDLPPQRHGALAQVQALLDAAQLQLRNLAHELRPAVLDDLGLGAALEALAERVAARSGLAIGVAVDLPAPRLAPVVETALYRIVQEGVNNAVKHAQARHAYIEVARSDNSVVCRVRDDGIGLPVNPLRPRGLGITGIQERLYALGGTLEILSQPMHGTTLHVQIPLTGQHDELPHTARR